MMTLREAEAPDLEFLYRVYASTRADEMAVTGWLAKNVDAFLRDLFRLQDIHYRRHYAGARFQVVLVGGVRAGRLYVHVGAKEVRIMDITLLPEFRRRGIGAALLGSVMAEADASGLPLSLNVETNNPARDWYRRLGFKESPWDGVYILMERPALASSEKP
jgi:ribosomal protein S18 acetylase RimI-like enzyme